MKSPERFLIIDYTDFKNKALTKADLLIYAYIKSYIRFNPKELFIKSNNFIAEELGLSRLSVIRGISHLEELKLIKVSIGKSKGVYSNRCIYLRDVKQEQLSDVVTLFESVYERIKNH